LCSLEKVAQSEEHASDLAQLILEAFGLGVG
jgi:hypothetical protein